MLYEEHKGKSGNHEIVTDKHRIEKLHEEHKGKKTEPQRKDWEPRDKHR
ncbi:MAG: hypothetical protein PWP46_851 [Fusobacteriaceae bacterium]|jgi:hypothetical protein|nr:hypothetical protein [Fusobacteriaceae bacterium]